jgi:guanylate kinase
MKNNKGKLLVITGFPASGKDSVISEFIKRNPHFRLIVGHTSRPIRKGEVEGVHYHFVSAKQFESMINGGKLLEHVRTGLYYKGTSLQEFEHVINGTNSIWRIELTRFTSFRETIDQNFESNIARKINLQSTKVLIKPESKKVALQRYFGRDKKSDIRDFYIRWEYEYKHYKAHKDKFPNIIVNRTGQLSQTVKALEKLIY